MDRKQALIVGSVAFDIIFSVHNKFKEELLLKDGDIADISMMLTAQNKKVFYGGTGGNIAYGLGIQGESPYLFSVVGDDFNHDYKTHLEDHNVNLKLVTKSGEHTATFYGISDLIKNQIGIFQPNTHGDYMENISLSDALSQEDLDTIKIAIFSPGTGLSIKNHLKEFREKAGVEPLVILDPSQVLSIFFTQDLLKECIQMSNIFIGNETEIDQLQKILNLNLDQVLNLGLQYIIETKGSDGCVIHSLDNKITIDPVQATNFVEQTGAGDAFRSGLVKGLLQDLNIADACRIGNIMGSLNVEAEGGQNYRLKF
jgi:adenosine kinase